LCTRFRTKYILIKQLVFVSDKNRIKALYFSTDVFLFYKKNMYLSKTSINENYVLMRIEKLEIKNKFVMPSTL